MDPLTETLETHCGIITVWHDTEESVIVWYDVELLWCGMMTGENVTLIAEKMGKGVPERISNCSLNYMCDE